MKFWSHKLFDIVMKMRHSETRPKLLPTCLNDNLTLALIVLMNSLKVRTSQTSKNVRICSTFMLMQHNNKAVLKSIVNIYRPECFTYGQPVQFMQVPSIKFHHNSFCFQKLEEKFKTEQSVQWLCLYPQKFNTYRQTGCQMHCNDFKMNYSDN